MSDSTAPKFAQLPLDVLYGIFHHLDIPDILRIRRVSRYLNKVSRHRDVWSDAHRKADFVCPPGPFLSQSARDLESALVPSFRLDRNLRHAGTTTRREKPTHKLREIRYTGVDLCVSLVFGRFLLVALSEEVRCYDLNLDAFDSNSGASIIYRSAGGTVRSFRCVSAIDVEGRAFACVVLTEAIRDRTQISTYSLNVAGQSEVTLDLLHQFDPDTFDRVVVDLGPRVIVIRCRVGSDANPDWRFVVLDVRARTQFLLPSSIHATWDAPETPEWTSIDEITPPTSISTSTHLLLAKSFHTQIAGWSTLFQAFPLPRPFIPDINVRNVVLLHDAILDPSTQDVLITLRVHAFEHSRPHSSLSRYGILRLSGRRGSSHDELELGTITFQLLGSLGHFSYTSFFRPSFNGAGRAFYMSEPGAWIVAALEYDVRDNINRGRGRGDDELEIADKVVEYPSILHFPSPRTLLDYDPYSGRICLRAAMSKYSVIEVFDLAV